MEKTNDDRRPSMEEVAGEIDDAIDAIEHQRARHLELALSVRARKRRVLERKRAKVAHVRGEDDPAVARLDRHIERNDAVAKAVELDAVPARHGSPDPEKDAWKLSGLVVDAQNDPMPGVRVTLCDENGRKRRGAPERKAGDDGHFELRVPVEPDQEPDEKRDRRSKTFVCARGSGRTQYVHPEPLMPEPGGVNFVEIHWSDDTRAPKQRRRDPGPSQKQRG